MLNVVCAVIMDHQGEVLAAQRSASMPHPLLWEFPGGKVKEGESFQTALEREIKEELDVHVKVLRQLSSVTYAYSDAKMICLIPFTCRIVSGNISLKEHKEYRWLKPSALLSLNWTPADLPIVEALQDFQF